MDREGARLNLKYGSIHGTYWMYYAISCSFCSAFLLERGYTNGEIGMVLAVGSVAAVFMQPILADFADRSKKLSLIGVTQIVTVILICLSLFLFVLQRKSLALLAIYVMIVAWNTSLQPLFNSLAFKLEETGVHINFGLCRSAGSLFYAIACAALGTMTEKIGVFVLPPAGLTVLVLLLVALFQTQKQFKVMSSRRPKIPANFITAENSIEAVAEVDYLLSENKGKTQAEQKSRSGTKKEPETCEEINLVMFIKRNKLFAAMNLGVVGLFFSNAILNNFMLQIVEGVGGSGEDMGRILSVMAFAEIPALVLFDKIKLRFSNECLLRIASISFALKIIIIYMADNVWLIYVAHIFQPLAFGLFLPAMVSFINEKMAKGEAIKGQALYTAMTTMGAVASSVTGGLMLDFSGPSFMLLVASSMTVLGAVIVNLIVGKVD